MEDQIKNLSALAPLFDEFFDISEAVVKLPKENEKIRKTFTFLGGYKQRFLMIYMAIPAISDKDREMVHNLLVNGMKLSWEDIAFMNLVEQVNITLKEALEELKPLHLICWGCEDALASTGIPMEKYKVVSLEGMKMLAVDSIGIYHDNQEMKKKLWGCIRELKGI